MKIFVVKGLAKEPDSSLNTFRLCYTRRIISWRQRAANYPYFYLTLTGVETMFTLGTQRINEQGHLEIGGCDAVELAAEFGTPLYVMDEAHIRGQMRAIKSAFQVQGVPTEIIYASKAFSCLAIARIADEEGLMIDVASAGELYTALRADFPAERASATFKPIARCRWPSNWGRTHARWQRRLPASWKSLICVCRRMWRDQDSSTSG